MSYKSYDDIDHRDKAPDAEARANFNVPGKFDRLDVGKNWLYTRLIPGDYEVVIFHEPNKPTVYHLPYVEFWRHFVKGAKPPYFTCLRSGNEFSDLATCPICMTDTDREPQRCFAFNVLGLAYYHEIEKMSDKQKAYIVNEPCARTKTNPNCPYCASKYKFHKGQLGHISFNSTDFEEIKKIHRKMRGHCSCGGDIVVFQASCPRCHNVLKNIETSKMSDSEFQDYLKSKQMCPECRVAVQPVEGRRCTKCDKPRPLSMFDCNLRMRRVEVPGKTYTKLEIEITRICSIDQIGEGYPKIEQFDLQAIYAPLPIGTLKRKVPGLRRALASTTDPGAADPNAMARDGLMPPMDLEPGDGEGAPIAEGVDDDHTEAVDREELPDIPDTSAPSMADALKKTAEAKAAKAPAKGKTAGKPALEPPPPLTGDLSSTDDAGDMPPDFEG